MPSRFAPPATRASGLSEFRFQARYQQFQASRHAVARPRLTGVLVGAAPELVLLAAPPGFGKSTLLAQWGDLDDRPFAYLSLAHGASDSGVFWGAVVEAIRDVVPDIGEATLAMLHAPGPAAHDAALPVLLDELEAAGTELVLVLDDYQAVTSRACHQSLSSFLENAPRQVTVAISTRADPPIPLARLRVLGELLELRATDLGFTSEEEAAFLNEALGLDLPPESLVRLHERTEGWPAGVQLAALSLAGVTDRASFVEHFGGSDGQVAALAEQRWPGNVRELRDHLERGGPPAELVPVGDGEPRVDPAEPIGSARSAWLRARERRYVTALLRRHGDDLAAAARAAGLDRVHFHRLLARHGLR